MATIRKRNGRWAAQVRIAGYKASHRTFDSKEAAEAWASRVEAERGLGSSDTDISPLHDKPYFRDLILRYRDDVTTHKRGAKSERYRLGKMALARLCSVKIDRLRPQHFAAYRDERLQQVSAGTVRRELLLFRAILHVAIEDWGFDLPSNAASMVRKPLVRDRRNRRLGSDEETRLLEALNICRNPLMRPLVRFLLETAMRRGEALALHWSDLDHAKAVIRLRECKNGEARDVPLTPMAQSLLVGLERQSKHVFPISASAVRQAWVRAVNRARLSDLRMHDLRHEALSRFSEIGLNTAELQAISGHRDVTMLVRYTHPHPSKISKRLARLLD